MKPFRPPVAGSFGAPTNLTINPATTGNLLTWSAVPGARFLVERRSNTDRDDPQNAGNPWAWERMTPVPISANLYLDEYARELEGYEYKVWSVDSAGNRSTTPAQGSVVGARWAPQNHLSHWSDDLSKTGYGGWIPSTAAITVTGAAGSQTVTFTAGNQSIEQTVFTMPLNARTYTFHFRVQGTAGQTVQFLAHDPDSSSFFNHLHTLSGAEEDVTFTRTFSTNGRRIKIGLHTFDGVTARAVKVLRSRVAAGNIARADMIAGYERTQGPGTTWCEPLDINNGTVSGLSSLTVQSWHRSYDATVPSVRNSQNAIPVIYQRLRSISRGHHLTAGTGLTRQEAYNCRFYSINPMKAGRFYGRAWAGDYVKRLIIEHCYWERTSGVRTGTFLGRTAEDTFRVKWNRVQDIDGRYVDNEGRYIESSYGSASGTRPGDAPLGWETAQVAYVYGLWDPGQTPTAGETETIGVEVAYNDIRNRPGFSRHEDLLNGHGLRGSPDSPVRWHHNSIWTCGPWDWHWHKTNDLTRPYNYGQIMTTFNVALTVSGSGAAQGATSLPVNALSGVIRTGATIALSNGVTATATGQANKGATSIPVQALSGAVPAGATATVVTTDGPGSYSGTAILTSDLFSADTGHLLKISRWMDCYSNLLIGVSAIMSIQAGADQWFYDTLVVSSGRMLSGLAPATQNRVAGVQITEYDNRAAVDSTAGSTVTLNAAAAQGAGTITTAPLTKKLSAGHELAFTNGVTTTVLLDAAVNATLVYVAALPGAVPTAITATATLRIKMWGNNGMRNCRFGVQNGGWSLGSSTPVAKSYGNQNITPPTAEEEWSYLGTFLTDLARGGNAPGVQA